MAGIKLSTIEKSNVSNGERFPIREQQVKLVKVEKKVLSYKERLIFTKYADTLISIIGQNPNTKSIAIHMEVVNWKKNILLYGINTKDVKSTIFSELNNRIKYVKHLYTMHGIDMDKKEKADFRELLSEIKDDVNNIYDISSNFPKRVPLTKEETSMFNKYVTKFVRLLKTVKGCDNSRNKIIESLYIWKNNFLMGGYRVGKSHEILTALLEEMVLVDIYFQDIDIDIKGLIKPLEDEIMDNDLYKEYAVNHPEYNHRTL